MRRPSTISRPGMGLLLALAVLAGLVVGCSGQPATTFTIDADGWTASPSVIESQQFRYSIVNNDTQSHQPVLVKTDRAPDGLPVLTAGYVDLSGMDVILPNLLGFGEFTADDDFVETMNDSTIEPGDSITASAGYGPALAPGTYVFFCFMPGHYEAGEHTTLEVVAS